MSFDKTVTALVPLTVIDKPSSFNAILGRTWIHAMKALPSSYHQMLSFWTLLGQIDIRGDQKTAKTSYKIKQQKDNASTNDSKIAEPLQQHPLFDPD